MDGYFMCASVKCTLFKFLMCSCCSVSFCMEILSTFSTTKSDMQADHENNLPKTCYIPPNNYPHQFQYLGPNHQPSYHTRVSRGMIEQHWPYQSHHLLFVLLH